MSYHWSVCLWRGSVAIGVVLQGCPFLTVVNGCGGHYWLQEVLRLYDPVEHGQSEHYPC